MTEDYNKQERLLDNVNDDSLFQKPLKPAKPWYRHWWLYIYLIILAVSIMVLVIFSQTTDQFLNKIDIDKEGIIPINISSFGFGQSFLSSKKEGKIDNYTPLESVLRNSQDDPALGNPQAKIVIVEFADFQCPYCRESAVILKKLLSRYPNDVYFIFRDFPITEIHPEALKAALAGQCAWEQGKFWELHDLFFARQDELNDKVIISLADQVGLDLDRFTNCMDSKKYLDEVLIDFEDGVNLGVAGTPTFFVNGYSVAGTVPLEKWEELIKVLKLSSEQ